FVVAPSVLERVRQDRQPIEGSLAVNARGEQQHIRGAPHGIDAQQPEWVAEDLAGDLGNVFVALPQESLDRPPVGTPSATAVGHFVGDIVNDAVSSSGWLRQAR